MFVGVQIMWWRVCWCSDNVVACLWCSEKVGPYLLVFKEGGTVFVGVQRMWDGV